MTRLTRCSARTTKGTRCRNRPIAGGDVCFLHSDTGGKQPRRRIGTKAATPSSDDAVELADDDYDIVVVTGGDHKGRIGYFDDVDFDFSETPSLSNHRASRGSKTSATKTRSESWTKFASVHFGDYYLVKGDYNIPFQFIKPVTTDDLIRRRDEIYQICGLVGTAKGEHRADLLCELNLVEAALVERLSDARYSTKKRRGMNVFISYSSKDRQFTRWIGVDLANTGHHIWFDEWKIQVGESIPQKIGEGIQNADALLVVLSQHSTKSKWVEREWQNKYWDEVNEGDVKVLPVLYQDCKIPELLKIKKYADFREDYNDGLQDILKALDSLSMARRTHNS